jgi:hypothetical protein
MPVDGPSPAGRAAARAVVFAALLLVGVGCGASEEAGSEFDGVGVAGGAAASSAGNAGASAGAGAGANGATGGAGGSGGFGALDTVMTEGRNELFEGSAHYKVKGKGQYLTLIEAIGAGGRYYRSWTASSLEGPWTPLAASEQNPFAGRSNVTYAPGVSDWTDDVSHGEIIRDGVDQTMMIDACNLRFLYQGRSPSSGGEYSQLPYRLGLLTFDP